jgi:hypothetical protein
MMQDQSANEGGEQSRDGNGPCATPFLLGQLKEGQKDKLGHTVKEILWVGQEYAVYRSEAGVYVQFSDSSDVAAEQRKKFTGISPELCELRYLTSEMRSSWIPDFFSRVFGKDRSIHYSTLFDRNIAQAVMLVMEGMTKDGEELAQQTLKMAVQRVTNDNTAKYFRCCVAVWLAGIAFGGVALAVFELTLHRPSHLVIAAIFGATGAMLSVALRLQDFKLQPCQQSTMNYLMSATRVAVGSISGTLLLLLATTILSGKITAALGDPIGWRVAAVIGLIGGFSERLIPSLLEQVIAQLAPQQAGTPVQAFRAEAKP